MDSLGILSYKCLILFFQGSDSLALVAYQVLVFLR